MKETKNNNFTEKEESTKHLGYSDNNISKAEKENHQNELSKLVYYADSSEVNMVDSKDDDDYLNIDVKNIKKQSMQGFGDYHNIIDYIIRITRQIWKEKDIGLIYDTYSHGVQIHRGLINSHGVNEVIAGTLQTLQSFPDRTGLGWSVVWSGNDKEGFFTSHRGRSIGTNLGNTLYGPATGKK